MALDWMDALQVVDEVSRLEASLDVQMARVIDFCAASTPHPDWSRLRLIAWETELQPMAAWIKRAVATDPPAKLVRALWFGICNPIVRDGGRTRTTADLYLAGATQFDPDDGECAWADEADWRPCDGLAGSTTLQRVYALSHAGDEPLEREAEYPLCLAFAAFSVQHALPTTLDSLRTLRNTEPLLVAVGFDGGDALVLGELDSGGRWLRT